MAREGSKTRRIDGAATMMRKPLPYGRGSEAAHGQDRAAGVSLRARTLTGAALSLFHGWREAAFGIFPRAVLLATRHVARCSIVAVCAVFFVACAGQEPPRPLFAVEQRYESDSASLILRIEKNPITVAETLKLSLEAVSPESVEARFPEPDGLLEDFETLAPDVPSVKLVEDSRVSRTQAYEAAPFLPGEYTLPVLAVEFSDLTRIETEELTVRVESLLAEGEPAEIADIAGPLEMPLPAGWIAAGVLAAAALAAAAVWLWRRWRKVSAEEVEPPPPPHEIALHDLDALLARNLLDAGDEKLFYLLLSDILRHYIENRFGLRAPERTTEEFLVEVREAGEFEDSQKELLRSFLRHCDLVKFAEVRPGREEAGKAAATCRGFIEQTRPAAAPEQVESAGEKAS